MTTEPTQPSLDAAPQKRRQARLMLGVLCALAVAGSCLGWNGGQLPERESIDTPAGKAEPTAPDLQLYREMIAGVRAGENYYELGRSKHLEHNFPIRSPFNWRLPTYAWLFAKLPGPLSIQATLVLLATAAILLAFAAQNRRSGLGVAAMLAFLQIGVVRWALDGDAYFAQEVWAATLILISVSAHALGFRWAAVVAGVAALLFREFALPFCLVAGGMALWNRRWWESAGWAAGVAAFFGFLAWHIGQVEEQLAAIGLSRSSDFSQWLKFGGLDFLLLTGRMNSLLFAAPAALLWLYLLASLFGLASSKDETSQVCCLAAVGYLLAFAIIGRPWNFYWGLMYAPLLPWGLVRFPEMLTALWRNAWQNGDSAVRLAAGSRTATASAS